MVDLRRVPVAERRVIARVVRVLLNEGGRGGTRLSQTALGRYLDLSQETVRRAQHEAGVGPWVRRQVLALIDRPTIAGALAWLEGPHEIHGYAPRVSERKSLTPKPTAASAHVGPVQVLTQMDGFDEHEAARLLASARMLAPAADDLTAYFWARRLAALVPAQVEQDRSGGREELSQQIDAGRL